MVGPSLDVLKIRLHTALSNLVYWKVFWPWQGTWNKKMLKDPSNPSHSAILWEREGLQTGTEDSRKTSQVSRKIHLQHEMICWACLLQLVARMVVYKIFKQGQLSLQDGLQQWNRRCIWSSWKKDDFIRSTFQDRKSLLQTKREKSTPVGTGDNIEKWLNLENKREGTRSEIVHLCPGKSF